MEITVFIWDFTSTQTPSFVLTYILCAQLISHFIFVSVFSNLSHMPWDDLFTFPDICLCFWKFSGIILCLLFYYLSNFSHKLQLNVLQTSSLLNVCYSKFHLYCMLDNLCLLHHKVYLAMPNLSWFVFNNYNTFMFSLHYITDG